MRKRKIAIFTGNRAEYGLQYPIIKAVSAHPDLAYFLLVSGAHLQEEFGYTKQEIKEDGFKVYGEVEIILPEDTLAGTAHAIGSGVLNMVKILKKLRPDILVVYADRFEGFAAVIAGSQMAIPTAHIEGGDITEGGALDDSVRHAMTKLSHIHFTTNEEAKNRILKLGEEPWRVHNVGFPVIDLIKEQKYASFKEIHEKFGINKEKPVVLFTKHSVRSEYDLVSKQIKPALEAMYDLSKQGIQIVITYPNNDAGGKKIIEDLIKLKKENVSNIQIHDSLGRYFYHGILNLCGSNGSGVCVGNSSSGIKETPAFGCPTVNIGSRQDGRLRSSNVIDVDYNKKEIINAINRGIYDNEFRSECGNCENPYGKGNSGEEIARVLAGTKISAELVQKKMTY